jgi:tetratricopeptide (TPR) repeat protein
VSGVGILAKLSEALRVKRPDRSRPEPNLSEAWSSPDTELQQLVLRARNTARSGDLEKAIELYSDVLALAPDFVDAIEARAELLDMTGHVEQSAAAYVEARRIKSAVRQGPPDRPFVARLRGNFFMEAASYDVVLRSSLKKNALPHLARGNAYLASGRPDRALIDYDNALKVKRGLVDAMVLRAEALLQLGRHDEALAAVDLVLAARSADTEALSSRAAILMALGRLEAANVDLNCQLALLPSSQAAARGCVALRLAAYEVAAAEFDSALIRQPGDAYWHLYRGVARIRLGGTTDGDAVLDEGQAWPQLLLAFQVGQASEQEVTAFADSDDRRAESWFQFGIRAIRKDREAARRHWQKVVDHCAPSLIEFAAARNELARC